ncbi:UDP-N-acetylmuramoyl-tripeptide--D-alanyl-D-alanine ligase [bacterium]|nr:UDP-N-acetylmuramoyl-tripeptide--D-alanyl-D-alanine ligase [bacterium]
MRILLIALWALHQIKAILFWVYLWQLKEYHRKRFIDHFRTHKGKSIFFNWQIGIKIVFLCLLFLVKSIFLVYIVLLLYLLGSLKSLVNFYKRRLKKPIFTFKATIICGGCFMLFAFIVSILLVFGVDIIQLVQWLLVMDLLTFLFVSLFVFLMHPLTLFFQYRLLQKAKNKREQFKDLIVIGITGSYGKTTTKEIISFVLAHKFKVLKTEKHINAEVGIAKTILEKLSDQEIFVVEMGAYERGKIKQVCKMVKPKIGVLTGINQQHMATFGSQKNIVKGKFELIEALPEDGVAVVNWDNRFINSKLKSQKSKPQLKSQKLKNIKIIKYAIKNKNEADVWAEDVKVQKEKLSFWISTKEGKKEFCEVNLIGGHNVYAILAACAVAKELGMSLNEIIQILKEIKPDFGAMKLKKGVGGINVIDASYSANPDGVISALDYLKIWENKKVIVMPCLIELGSVSKEVHRKIGEKIAEVCDLAIITTKDRFKEIQEGAIKKGMNKEGIVFIDQPKKIAETIKNFCQEKDIVLLEGRVPSGLVDLLILPQE